MTDSTFHIASGAMTSTASSARPIGPLTSKEVMYLGPPDSFDRLVFAVPELLGFGRARTGLLVSG